MNSFGNYKTQLYGNTAVQGIGAQNEIVGLSWFALSGKAGEIYTPSYMDVYGRTVANTPMSVQATGNDVKLSFTLENPGFACSDDPLVRDSVNWVNEVTISPGAIVNLDIATFVVMRIEFVGDATIYMAGR